MVKKMEKENQYGITLLNKMSPRTKLSFQLVRGANNEIFYRRYSEIQNWYC